VTIPAVDAETRLQQLIGLIVQVQAVRAHQKEYFRFRSREALVASKQAETRLDKTVRAIIATLPKDHLPEDPDAED